MDTVATLIVKTRKKKPAQLLKEYNVTVEEAEQLFEEIFDALEKNEKDEDAQNANKMEELNITE